MRDRACHRQNLQLTDIEPWHLFLQSLWLWGSWTCSLLGGGCHRLGQGEKEEARLTEGNTIECVLYWGCCDKSWTFDGPIEGKGQCQFS